MSVASFARVIGRRVFRQSFVLIYGRGCTVSLLFRVGKPRGERTWRLQDLYPGHCGAHQPSDKRATELEDAHLEPKGNGRS